MRGDGMTYLHKYISILEYKYRQVQLYIRIKYQSKAFLHMFVPY